MTPWTTVAIGQETWKINMEDQLTTLYEENYNSYLSQAKKFLKDHHYAEDCVQEAFEDALKYLKTYRGPCLESWFSSVFRNKVRDYHNFIRNAGMVIELKYKDHPIFPDEIVDRYKGVIEEEIEKFSKKPVENKTLTCYFLRGYGARLTAISCETTESAVYSLAHRFRNHLAHKYEIICS
jgi:RNA polymerase sigma factor (sigma-70 family)